jgi:tetratricopeptide (TPR) repeat protein
MARGPGKSSTAWLAVAACVGFSAGAAEADDPAEDFSAITEPLLATIGEEEARNGPLSRDLIDPLTSLGLAYQENGDHLLAVAVLDRALHLQRVDAGLFTMDQAALVRRIIDSERAIGRSGSAEELEARLLELARRNFADPRSVTIFRDAAERNFDYYERYRRGEIPAAFALDETRAETAMMSLWRARGHYNEAIAAVRRSGGTEPGELVELEEHLTRTYYVEGSERRGFSRNDFGYYGGVMSYRRRLGYLNDGSPTAIEYARTLVELADWSLLYSVNGTAMKTYTQAHALLVEQQVPAASIEELFPTDVPVFLPAFESLGGAPIEGSAGHVDVDFEIGKYGQPRRVTIVSVAGAEAQAASKELIAAISRGRFRPNLDGPTAYRVRYSLADGTLTPRF